MRAKKALLAPLVVAMVAAAVLLLLEPFDQSTASGGQAGEPAPASLVPGEIIIGLVPGADIGSVAADHGIAIEASVADGRFYLLGVAPGGEETRARELAGDLRVRFAEPNWLRELHSGPDDDGFFLKWDLHNTGDTSICDGSECPTADADIDWHEAYHGLSEATFSSVVIAVLDTGVDPNHLDLAAKLVDGTDCTSGTCGAPSDDGFGHGTHVSGIAAAVTNNGAGSGDVDTAGVAFDNGVQVMPVKVCSDTGSCPTSAIVAGIHHAADNGAKVINMSLGGPTISQAEQDAIAYAWGKGVLLVASAGNDGTTQKNYPAAHEPVMAIAATNWDDERASYSNYGADWVDLAAPGGDMDRYDDPGGIYSTMPTYEVYLTECVQTGPPWARRPCYDTHYDQLQGTSMAAPQVSGAAALLFSLDSGRSNADVRSLLEGVADPISGTGSLWANGRLNVCKAAGLADCDVAGPAPTATATATEEPTATPAATPTPTSTPSGGISLTASGYKVRGLQKADLEWNGAASTNVDVYRDGVRIATTENDGFYSDNIDQRGPGSYTYQVCEEGTATCSNEATVTFG